MYESIVSRLMGLAQELIPSKSHRLDQFLTWPRVGFDVQHIGPTNISVFDRDEMEIYEERETKSSVGYACQRAKNTHLHQSRYSTWGRGQPIDCRRPPKSRNHVDGIGA